LSNVIAAYFIFVWHTVFDDLFQMVTCFYIVEQGSAINNLSISSALYIREHAKSSLVLSQPEYFCCQSCLLSSHCFAMTALLQTSQKAFLESAG